METMIRELLIVTDGTTVAKSNTQPRSPRKFVMVELTDSERAKLERLRDARGERGTLAGVFRELLGRADDGTARAAVEACRRSEDLCQVCDGPRGCCACTLAE